MRGMGERAGCVGGDFVDVYVNRLCCYWWWSGALAIKRFRMGKASLNLLCVMPNLRNHSQMRRS